jgi:hypothetical protein
MVCRPPYGLEEQRVHAARLGALPLDAFHLVLGQDDLAGCEDLGLDQVPADHLARRLRSEDVQVGVHAPGFGRHQVALEAEQVQRPLDPVDGHARLGDRQTGAGLDIAELDVAHRSDRRDDRAVLEADVTGEEQQLLDQLRPWPDADDEPAALPAFLEGEFVHVPTPPRPAEGPSRPGPRWHSRGHRGR